MAIRCIKCKSDNSSVMDSRPHGDVITRRRQCKKCFHRFTTYEAEVIDVGIDLSKLNKDTRYAIGVLVDALPKSST